MPHRIAAWPRDVAKAVLTAADSARSAAREADGDAPRGAGGAGSLLPTLAPTPRHVVAREGTTRLLHFESADVARDVRGTPLLVIPSLINRWYVLDLRPGASLVSALVAAGIDVWMLDWGIPEDEDRYLSWEAVLARLARASRRVRRATGARRVGILGYCMGGTLSAIHTALHPERVAALVNLAGPIDFSRGGALRHFVDPRWFDGEAVGAAGNVSPHQMQAGFTALRPTLDLAKAVGFPERVKERSSREAFFALEAWASDNIPFPGAAYKTYIRELYQENRLLEGTHRVRGRRVDLGRIRCPVLAISATRDSICPADAATALTEACGSDDTEVLSVPGGHVGAVVGSRAARSMYPATAAWLQKRLGVRAFTSVDNPTQEHKE